MGRASGSCSEHQARRSVGHRSAQALAGLVGDARHSFGGDLELTGEADELPRCVGPKGAKRTSGVDGDMPGFPDGIRSDADHLGVDGLDFLFCLTCASPEIGGDGAGMRTHQERPVTGLDPRGEPGSFQALDRLGHLGHALGQEPRVGRVGDVRWHHGRVRAHPVGLEHLGGVGLRQEGLVQPLDRRGATARRDLHERRRMRDGGAKGDPTEALPRDRVGRLAPQRLEPEPVAELQEHKPQVRLDRHRWATQHNVEVSHERLEEGLVIEQAVDRFELGGHPQTHRWQERFPEGGLRV
jgi:hypothetical protein